MQFNKMRIEVLGCGTSTGVPLIHCTCKVCRSKNPKNKRLRASLWVQVDGVSLLMDASVDLRQQAIRSKIGRLDAVLFTHPHADHIGGIDEIRSFNFIQKMSMPVYAHAWTMNDIQTRFPYLFGKVPVEGGGVASLELHEFGFDGKSFHVKGIEVLPIALPHGSQTVAGFRIGNFAYLTDCHEIPDAALRQLQGLDVVIMDCLRLPAHSTHMNYETALVYSKRIGAKKTIFTHMGHDFDYVSFSKSLPKNHFLAYDGQILNLKCQLKGKAHDRRRTKGNQK